MTERFKFLQPELDERAEKWPANLRREFQINKHYDRVCVVEVEGGET